MKKRNKKEITLIITLIILICLVIGIVLIKIIHEPKEEKLSFEEYLTETIAEINEVNKVFDYIDVDSGSNYELNEDFVCYKYNGENQDEYIKKIENLYIEPFHEYSSFNIVTSHSDDKEEQELYVCKRKDCEILEITDYEVTYENNDRKLIKFTQESIVTTINIYKVNNEWKFKIPIVICK